MLKMCQNALRALAAALLLSLTAATGALAQSGPIKVGVGLALTGAGAPAGKMILASLELWRDDVNAKGGLLGRQVELVHYDDQSNPSNVPGVYTKLITVDKVDLLMGPYATNFTAPAMPTIIQNNKMTISFTAIGINDQFKYNKYFSMVAVGPDGVVRYTLVARSPSGADTISYEGIRCGGQGLVRIYAFAYGGKWSRNPSADWKVIEPRGVQRWHAVLRSQFFCPGRFGIQTAEEGVDALRRGKHPAVVNVGI